MIVADEKASGTDGGSFTAGSWVTRTLNTVRTNGITGASLSSNQITLPAGTYHISARSPAFAVQSHQTLLYNVTSGATALVGSTAWAAPAGNVGNDSFVEGTITVASSTVFELRHRCSSTKNTTGLGAAGGFGEVEVYSVVVIRKIQ